jgi:coenzyme PQQ precursor peptide PqqA
MRTYEKTVFNPFRMRTYKKYRGVGSAHFHSSRLPLARVILSWLSGTQGAASMEWTTPTHEEIDLSCEINSYANAEL